MHSVAHAGVFKKALERHEWPRTTQELLDISKQYWMGMAIYRLLYIVNPMRAAFKGIIEQQGLTWELTWKQLIDAKLDKIREACQCPG
jgi:hypothetical protein